MPEKRRTRSAGGLPKDQRTTTQMTLKDLFRRENSDSVPSAKEQDLPTEDANPVPPSPQAADPYPVLVPLPRPPKPSKLFPIFTGASSVHEKPPDPIINVDDTEIIDVTDPPSNGEFSTQQPLSQASSHPESSQAASRLPPHSTKGLDMHCSGGTRSPHAAMHLHKTSKGVHKRTPGREDAAPLPSSCSQHVRGVQHFYTCSQAFPKRSIFPSCSPSDEGTLDFLATWRRLDDTLSSRLDRIDRSLTQQQCEEYLQSFRHDCTELHPAFAQISFHQEGTLLSHAETWTRRFRPRRANEVLGNERHALYLRDWLRALELHLQGREPDEPVQKGGPANQNKEKSNSKRPGPRGMKRPRIIRAVAKKRGNKKRRVDSDDDMDDFVVYSNADEEEVDDFSEESEDELASCEHNLTRLHRRDTTDMNDTNPESTNIHGKETGHRTSRLLESVQTDFTDNLTNSLLITGPSGCGKTAAVYACAEELGFEIFEVHPGIGKRNGASLEHLVGDVGKNHIVQTVHGRAPRKMTQTEVKERMELRGYLDKGNASESAGFGESHKAGSAGEPISVVDDSPTHGVQPLPRDQEMDSLEEGAMVGKRRAESDGSGRIVRQSLVLLEEVDILFKEDAGFWPAVIDFIRCCRRPVVMTCNDPGLVPVADLPLQKVLIFEPCPGPVAATFLQCVSLTEGCLVPHEDLMVLYEGRDAKNGFDVPDGRGYPRTEPVVLPDLRRSIMQLQMLCAGARHESTSKKQQGEEASGHARRSGRPISAASRVAPTGSRVESDWWRQMKRESELMSHVDGELCWTGMGTVEVTREEEVGYAFLGVREGGVFREHDELIAEEATRYSRGEHEECGTGPNEASISPAAGLGRARVEYQTRMVEALAEIVLAPGPLMGQSWVYLDYIPIVGQMVRVDDDLERRALEGRGGGRGRCTRNSARTVHARSVGIEEGQRELWRRSGLYLEDI